MTRSPRASVVIPAYNAPRTIVSTIRSIRAQTEEDWELIVVDDGSSDETPEVVEGLTAEDARIRLIRQENQGVAGARNTGIGEAAADVVAFVDNDDVWLPQYLEAMLGALDAAPDAGLAYTDGWAFDDRRKRIFKESAMVLARPPESPAGTREGLLVQLAHSNFILSSAAMRRVALAEVGGFDPSVTGSDDYDLWVKLALAGYGFVKPAGRLVIQRDRSDSQSKDELPTYTRHHEVIRRIAEGDDVPESARAVARGRLAENERYLAAITGRDPRLARRHRMRRALGSIRRAIVPRRSYRRPPPEIAAAFPDLRSL